MPVVRVSLVGVLLSIARLLFTGHAKRSTRFVTVTDRGFLFPLFLGDLSHA